MDQSFEGVLHGLNAMDPDQVKSNGQRRFREAVEVPLARALGLRVPENGSDLENVYVTWVADTNNIDNRMWQVQNKLLKGQDCRVAIAICNASIADNPMWMQSAKVLSEVAPYLNASNFVGIVIVVTGDDRQTFQVKKKILLRGAALSDGIDHLTPEIPTEWYSVPLATRRPRIAAGKQDSASELAQAIRAYRNVVVQGVAGIGKSHLFSGLADSFGGSQYVEVAVFHPSSNYEDFVEALRPVDGHFEVVDGRFLAFCKRAASDPDHDYLFVVDEINRAAPARVLGDLLYSIEASKRVNAATARSILEGTPWVAESDEGDPQSIPVQLQLMRTSGPSRTPYRASFCIPDNVYILGTMNTSDHSVGGIDLALRRRFVFRRHEPMSASDLIASLVRIDERWIILKTEIEAWSELNRTLGAVSPDALLGHSYFFEAITAAERMRVSDDAAAVTRMLWHDLLLPQLGAILESFDAVHLIQELDVAVRASGSTSGGSWISVFGSGLDARVLVEPRDSNFAEFGQD